MFIAKVQFAPWDKAYSFSVGDLDIKAGDYVLVETELGRELGCVKSLTTDMSGLETRELKPILKKADYEDVAKLPDRQRKAKALAVCRQLIAKHALPMKLVDVHFSFAGNRLNFAFIAASRVDFRELVKDLVAHFNANIRLTQIGTRDEAKLSGDCGPCGRRLCCQEFLGEFSSITSEMAEAQQVVHRGNERISGMCGRLMCCLSFEYEGYKELAGQLAPPGTRVNINGVSGVVVGHHILKQTLDVKIAGEKEGEEDVVIEVDPKRRPKKEAEKKIEKKKEKGQSKPGRDRKRERKRK